MSGAEFDAAITAAISDNYVVVDPGVYQDGVDITAAAESMLKHMMRALSLLDYCRGDTEAQVSDLWNEVEKRNYLASIKRARATFGLRPGAKLLLPRKSDPKAAPKKD